MRVVAADEPLGEASEAEWERLLRQMELASGFWLGFVFTPSPRSARVLEARVGRVLEARDQALLVIRPDRPEELRGVLPQLAGALAPLAAGATWVEAVRSDAPGSIDAPWTRAWDDLFLRMNEHRDALRARLPGGLVFVGTPELKPRVREAAPDLWSVRSLVVELRAVPTPGAEVPKEAARVATELSPEAAPDPEFALAEALRRKAQGATKSQGFALLDVVEGLLARKDHVTARGMAEGALELFKGRGTPEEARALALLAQAERALGALGNAAEHIEQALALWDAIEGGLAPIEWYDLLGEVALSRRGGSGSAQRIYTEAEAVARAQLRARETPDTLRALIVLLRRYEQHRYFIGDWSIRRDALEEAARLSQRLVELEGETQASLDDQERALYDLGFLQFVAGHLAAAITAFEGALVCCRKRIERFGETPRALGALANTMMWVAQAERAAGDLVGAAVTLEECTATTRRLVALDGARHRDLHAAMLRFLAEVRYAQGDEARGRAAEQEADAPGNRG